MVTSFTEKIIPAVKLGTMTSMSRGRSNFLWNALGWSHQPKDGSDDRSHAEYCWMLIDDMVDIFLINWICVYKSISRWYGLGDQWIYVGLLILCVVFDRKLESGCEIQK